MSLTSYEVVVVGLNLHKLLLAITQNNIQIKSCKKTAQNKTLLVFDNDNYMAFMKLEALKYFSVSAEKKSKLTKLLSFFLMHIGVILGLLVSFFMFYLVSQQVFDIQIVGEANHTCSNRDRCVFTEQNKGELLSYMESLGLYSGAKTRKIDTKEIERKLAGAYPEIASSIITIKGNHVFVEIHEATLEQKELNRIRAKANGTIDKIVAVSGKTLVAVGDYAKSGDVLIETEEDGVAVGYAVITETYTKSIVFDKDFSQIVANSNSYYSKINTLTSNLDENGSNNAFFVETNFVLLPSTYMVTKLDEQDRENEIIKLQNMIEEDLKKQANVQMGEKYTIKFSQKQLAENLIELVGELQIQRIIS